MGQMYPSDDECMEDFLSRIKEDLERLKAICMAVQLRTPGLQFTDTFMRQRQRIGDPVYSNLKSYSGTGGNRFAVMKSRYASI